MSEQRFTTEEAERIAEKVESIPWPIFSNLQERTSRDRCEKAAAALRSLAAERDALREAMETATDCCARATACGRILRDALGENQP